MREVGLDLIGGGAFVAGAVHGGRGVPILLAGFCGEVTEGRSKQQFGLEKLAAFALFCGAIDAIACEIGFGVDGPGEVDDGSVVFAGENGSDKILRSGGRESVARRDDGRCGIVGFDGIAGDGGDAADQIDIGFVELEERVAVGIFRGLREENQRTLPFGSG